MQNALIAVRTLPQQSLKGFQSYAPIAAAYCEVKTMSWEDELEKMEYGKKEDGKMEEDKDEEYGDGDDDDGDDDDDDFGDDDY